MKAKTQPLEMSASDKLVREVTVATDASIGVIAIRCPATEIYRVVDDLYALAMTNSTEFRLHTAELGWSSFARLEPDDINAEPFDPLVPQGSEKATADVAKAFEHFSSGALANEGFFVMLDLYFTFSEMLTQTRIRKQVQRSLSNGQRLFLIVPDQAELPDAIAPLMHVIEFGYPTRDELKVSLYDMLDALSEEDKLVLTEDQTDAVLSNGQGMTTNAFETAVALAITEYGTIHEELSGFSVDDILNSIRDYKTQLLRKTNVLELQPQVPENEIGGLDLFKEWMHQRKHTYTDISVERGVTPSRGALVVGPPGTGKSLVAKAAGSILNLPVIRFDVGRVFGAYVGQSEQSMRSVLSLIDAMAPCVLMLDEIDKGFAGMGGDGGGGDGGHGTTQRVFGTFLTWMQERNQLRRPVFLIMTANRVGGLPPELLRKGRVDEIWAVTVPNTTERGEILSIHAKKRGQKLNKETLAGAKRLSDGLVGAEIEAMVEEALVLSLQEEKPGITYALLERAKLYLKPMSLTRAREFTAMKDWAETNARAASSPEISDAPERPAKGIRGRKSKRVKARVTREVIDDE